MPNRRASYARSWFVLAMVGLMTVAAFAAEQVSAPPRPPLGASEAELRSRFGDALRIEDVARARSVYEQISEKGSDAQSEEASEPVRDPYAKQKRLARTATGDVQRIEFDLFEEHIYRVRWQLASRFERPVMNALVASLRARWGEPAYDQTLHAAIGSGRSDLRRAGWTRGIRAVELRQLHTLNGGPTFLSVTDRDRAQLIVDAGGTPLPQPETTGDWWRRPQSPPALLAPSEQDELVAGLANLVDSLAPGDPQD